jgi:hypothetical protein
MTTAWILFCIYMQYEGAVKEDGRGKTIWDKFAHTFGMYDDMSPALFHSLSLSLSHARISTCCSNTICVPHYRVQVRLQT